MLTRLESPLSEQALRLALEGAWERRVEAGLGDDATTAYRLVHREADTLSGLTIDRLGDVAWVVYRNAGYASQSAVETTVDVLKARGIERFVWRYDRPANQGDDPYDSEALAQATLTTLGVTLEAEAVIARESGLTYEFAADRGLSHGLFFDMRQVRADLRERWTGRRVLNLFAYTCGFGVVLCPHNEVINVDTGKRYLDWGKRNYVLNDLPVPANAFVAKDAFAYLEIAAKLGNRFDAIVLDPPTFSHGKKGKARRFSIPKDLGPLLDLAFGALAPDGELFVSTNAEQLGHDTFARICRERATDAGRRVRQSWKPGADHPVAPREYHLKNALIT